MEEIKNLPADNYEKARIMIEEARLKCQASLASCGQSLQSLNVCMKTINDTTQTINDFKTKYSEAMNDLCRRCSTALKPLVPIFRKNGNTSIQCDSKQSSIPECVEILKAKKKIVLLTGAGISVASGIPSFRGVGAAELFQKNGVTYRNEEIDTEDFMKTKPEIFWERQFQFIETMKGKKENISHRKIQELREFVCGSQESEQKQQVILVTQNVDGLHNMAAEKSQNKKKDQDKNYFEIHGNNNYLRCDNEKCELADKLVEYPENYKTYEELTCLQCKEQLRPNLLFFDEEYDEKHYRTDTLTSILEDMDALVCIGTMLETSFPADMVTQAIEKRITLIEINLDPVIEVGGLILKGKAEVIVPAICDSLMSKKLEKPKEKPLNVANIPNKNLSIVSNNLNNKNNKPSLVKINKIIAPTQTKGNPRIVAQKKSRDDNKKKL